MLYLSFQVDEVPHLSYTTKSITFDSIRSSGVFEGRPLYRWVLLVDLTVWGEGMDPMAFKVRYWAFASSLFEWSCA